MASECPRRRSLAVTWHIWGPAAMLSVIVLACSEPEVPPSTATGRDLAATPTSRVSSPTPSPVPAARSVSGSTILVTPPTPSEARPVGAPTREPTVHLSRQGGETPVARPAADLAAYFETLTRSADPFFGTQQRTQLVQNVKASSPRFHDTFVISRIELAADYLRFGEAHEAVALLKEALEAENRDDRNGEHRARLMIDLAVAYLKIGELDNRLTPAGALICTLPLDNSAVDSNTFGSGNAIKYLLELLEVEPETLRARWLLNIAHMTLGTYPTGVPTPYLVPRDALDGDHDVGRFNNVAAAVGISTLDTAGGSIVEDFDNDGYLDIVTSSWDPSEAIKYFHNDANGLFSDYTGQAGLEDQLGGLNVVQADYNNDGWTDIFVMRGAWLNERGQMRNSLLRNNGDGTFTDVTRLAGLADPASPSQTAAWGDFDNDGDLDVYVCNESEIFRFPSQLFRNNGDGTFTDVASHAGVTNLRYCKGTVWGDYDNDRDPDLYVSNLGGENRLYRNNGDGSFTDVAKQLGVEEPYFSFPTWFWDYDNDGWLDLFVGGYASDIGHVAASYLGLGDVDGGPDTYPRLYRNDGRGGFTDVTGQAGIDRAVPAMGANFGDLDNDGRLDFYLGTGYPSFEALVPNVMFRNDEAGSFTDVTFSGGFGHMQKGHGIAFGDLDRDGDQDILAQIGGAYPGNPFYNALYENPGHGNRWMSVHLVGAESNRAGIGARIRVEVSTGIGRRSITARVSSGGSFGASTLEQEIGLGPAQRIESLTVYWPTSDTLQEFRDLPADTRYEIREDSEKYTIVNLPSVRLGAGFFGSTAR